MRISTFSVVLGSFLFAASSHASITQFIDHISDFDAAAGSVTKLDFVSPPAGAGGILAPSTYASYGLTLSTTFPGQPVYSVTNADGFNSLDNWGIAVASTPNTFHEFIFDDPIHAFGFRSPYVETAVCDFYLNDQLVTTNAISLFGVPDGSHFMGWVADFEFDRVVLYTRFADDIHFSTIPAPAAVTLLGLGRFVGRSRKRG